MIITSILDMCISIMRYFLNFSKRKWYVVQRTCMSLLFGVLIQSLVTSFELNHILNNHHQATSCAFNSNISSSNLSDVYFSVHARKDGMGSSTIHFLYAAAYCAYRKWRFLGVSHMHNTHGVSNALFFDFLFGNHSYLTRDINVRKYKFDLNAMVGLDPHMNELRYNPATQSFHLNPINKTYIEPEGGGSNFYLDWIHPKGYDMLLNPIFLGDIRNHAVCGVADQLRRKLHFGRSFEGNHLRSIGHNLSTEYQRHIYVAVHIRRGDVENIGPPLQFHLLIFEALFKLYRSGLEIHIFTEAMKANERKILRDFNSKHIVKLNSNSKDTGKNRSVLHIHNDMFTHDKQYDFDKRVTLAMQNTLSHLMTADILIKAHSGFSQLAGYYNPNCVIHTRYMRSISHHHQLSYLSHWLYMNGNETDLNATVAMLKLQLPKCLKSKLGSLIELETIT